MQNYINIKISDKFTWVGSSNDIHYAATHLHKDLQQCNGRKVLRCFKCNKFTLTGSTINLSKKGVSHYHCYRSNEKLNYVDFFKIIYNIEIKELTDKIMKQNLEDIVTIGQRVYGKDGLSDDDYEIYYDKLLKILQNINQITMPSCSDEEFDNIHKALVSGQYRNILQKLYDFRDIFDKYTDKNDKDPQEFAEEVLQTFNPKYKKPSQSSQSSMLIKIPLNTNFEEYLQESLSEISPLFLPD